MHVTQRTVLILFVVVFFVYTIPLTYNALVTPFFHVIPSQDVVSASLVPVSILTRDNVYLDQYRRYVANNYPEPYFVAEVNNHLVSRYPIAAGVLSMPFIGWGLGTGWIARTDAAVCVGVDSVVVHIEQFTETCGACLRARDERAFICDGHCEFFFRT